MEHLLKDCTHTYDIRAIPVEEQQELLQLLLAAEDIREAKLAHTTEEGESAEEEIQEEDFGSSRR
jgi:hypothetical protein